MSEKLPRGHASPPDRSQSYPGLSGGSPSDTGSPRPQIAAKIDLGPPASHSRYHLPSPELPPLGASEAAREQDNSVELLDTRLVHGGQEGNADPIKRQRELVWQSFAEEVGNIGKDGFSVTGKVPAPMDMPLDPEAKRVVTGLHAHGLPTTMSCGGHVKGDNKIILRPPCVLIGENLSGGVPTETTKAKNAAILSNMTGLLDEFYEGRDSDQLLAARRYPPSQSDIVQLYVRGHEQQPQVVSSDERGAAERKLTRYQNEIEEFAQFLKIKFFE